jgi:hypothetical protein
MNLLTREFNNLEMLLKNAIVRRFARMPSFTQQRRNASESIRIIAIKMTQSFARKSNRLTETIIEERKRPNKYENTAKFKICQFAMFFIFQSSIYKN